MKKAKTQYLIGVLLVLVVVSSGCVTMNPSVNANTSSSSVFESLSVTEPWAGHHTQVNASLKSTPDAKNTTLITVIGSNNQAYTTVSVASGQTSVTVWIPTGQSSTLVASNDVNSTTLDTLNVSSDGNKVI